MDIWDERADRTWQPWIEQELAALEVEATELGLASDHDLYGVLARQGLERMEARLDALIRKLPSAPLLREAPRFWLLREDWEQRTAFSRLVEENQALGVSWSADAAAAENSLTNILGGVAPEDVEVPDWLPKPHLALPEEGFAPDFFTWQHQRFGSQKLREALAVEPEVVQHSGVFLDTAGEAAQAQMYRKLRVRVRRPAMDLWRSDCDSEDTPNGRRARRVVRFVLRPDLFGGPEIFRIEHAPSQVLVSDRLAERVLRAGCTGVAFIDPTGLLAGPRVERFRTADGIGERRIGV